MSVACTAVMHRRRDGRWLLAVAAAGPHARRASADPVGSRLPAAGQSRAVAQFGAAHAPAPDFRCAHPGLRSLDAACAPPSMAPLVSNAGSQGAG